VTDELGRTVRSLTRRPGVGVVVVLTLALGIGASTAIFTVLDAVLLRPLPYADSGRLVAIFTHEVRKGALRNPSSPADFLEWKRQSRTLDDMTAAHPWSPVLTGRGQPEPIPALKATPELFTLLGQKAALGRTFSGSDDGAEEDVVVLSDRLWRSRFGADPAIVGQSLTLDGRPYTVAGVTPPGFSFPPFWATDALMWTPLRLGAADQADDSHYLRVFARLRPGVSLADARSELDVVERRLAAARPLSHSGMEANVEPLREPVVSDVRPALLLLAGAVALVLLIACANVASLLLAQGARRGRDLALRAALGASRGRLVGHQLREALLLAVLGGALGLALAALGVSALRHLSPDGFPRLGEVRLDARVVAFDLVLSVLTAALAGLVPALRGSRVDLVSALKAGDRASRGGGRRLTDLLVVAEFALAMVLLLGAGLLARSFLKLLDPAPGFEAASLLTAQVSFSASPLGDPSRQGPFLDDLLARVRQVPGVETAALVNHAPIAGDTWSLSFAVEGRPSAPENPPQAVFRVASADYLRGMGIRLVRGRGFAADASREVLVNQALARRYLADGHAVGHRLRPGGHDARGPWLTVVGVFADVRQRELTAPVDPEIVFPYSDNPTTWYRATTLLVRTPVDPQSLAEAIKAAVWTIDPSLPVTRVRPMTAVLAGAIGAQRENAVLLGLFAGVALLLAGVGIYGVMAYAVARRTAEIGVRMALGAHAGRVFGSVVGRGLALGARGALVGLLGAYALWRALSASLSGLLFEVQPSDPLVLAGVPLLLLLAAATACALPAWRAARVDPVTALRQD
jgi:predicted permease